MVSIIIASPTKHQAGTWLKKLVKRFSFTHELYGGLARALEKGFLEKIKLTFYALTDN